MSNVLGINIYYKIYLIKGTAPLFFGRGPLSNYTIPIHLNNFYANFIYWENLCRFRRVNFFTNNKSFNKFYSGFPETC